MLGLGEGREGERERRRSDERKDAGGEVDMSVCGRVDKSGEGIGTCGRGETLGEVWLYEQH